MKKAFFVILSLLISLSAFAGGRVESFDRNTDPNYDFVKDNSVEPTGTWSNVFETTFDTESQSFVPTVVKRTCTDLYVYVDYLPIKEIQWGVAQNEARKTYFEVYVISSPVAAPKLQMEGNDSPKIETAGGSDTITLLSQSDVGDVVSYRFIGRTVVFDFNNLPPTTKKVAIKIQTGDANRYVETNFRQD